MTVIPVSRKSSSLLNTARFVQRTDNIDFQSKIQLCEQKMKPSRKNFDLLNLLNLTLQALRLGPENLKVVNLIRVLTSQQ